MPRNNPEYDDWPVDGHDGDRQFVGVTDGAVDAGTRPAAPVFYDEETGSFFGTSVDSDNERLERHPDREWQLDATETIGEGIERIGDELGWDGLSEFAEEHLEDDEDG